MVQATNVDVRLWAELENGQRIEGESNIGHAPSPIVRLGCLPEQPPALPRALEAIANADLIVLGPGSLYTSLLPNLLVPELVSAIKRSRAPRLYICNLMTQPVKRMGWRCAATSAPWRSWRSGHRPTVVYGRAGPGRSTGLRAGEVLPQSRR